MSLFSNVHVFLIVTRLFFGQVVFQISFWNTLLTVYNELFNIKIENCSLFSFYSCVILCYYFHCVFLSGNGSFFTRFALQYFAFKRLFLLNRLTLIRDP